MFETGIEGNLLAHCDEAMIFDCQAWGEIQISGSVRP